MRTHILKALAVTGAFAVAGCLGSAPTDPGMTGTGGSTGTGSGGSTGGDNSAQQIPPSIANRVIDYGQAARTAALKLVQRLPTMDEIGTVKDATSYAALIDKYLADPAFAFAIRSYFRDLMKMGGSISVTKGGQQVQVDLETAPTFAAELVVKGQPMTNLFTQAMNTCPTLDQMGNFTDANCAVANGLASSGVLTDPGAMAQFYSNMAFRRVRWIQESFVCTKFPAEYGPSPTPMGAGQYVSPWPFTSIEGGTDKTVAPINFQDTSSVVCANCHTTMNHIAPLFSYFDVTGVYQTTIQVHTPTPMSPITKLTDWLPAGQQQLAWRFGQPVSSITDLGKAMAGDQSVMTCQVDRAWNWAFSKTDIVNDLTIVPMSTVQTIEQLFVSNGYLLKPALKAIFTSDDFVKF